MTRRSKQISKMLGTELICQLFEAGGNTTFLKTSPNKIYQSLLQRYLGKFIFRE
jgi:hypothetical protein